VRIVRVVLGRFLGRSDLVVGAGLGRGGRGRAVLVLSLGAAGVLGLTAGRGVAGVFLLGRGVSAAHPGRTLGLALAGVLLFALVALVFGAGAVAAGFALGRRGGIGPLAALIALGAGPGLAAAAFRLALIVLLILVLLLSSVLGLGLLALGV